MPVYAAPDGVTGNDGSESAPWPLQHAIDQLDATDDHVLLLLAGVYGLAVPGGGQAMTFVNVLEVHRPIPIPSPTGPASSRRHREGCRQTATPACWCPPATAPYAFTDLGTLNMSIDLRGVHDFVLMGEGPRSVLAMVGPGSWRLIHIGDATDVVVRDLCLDGSKAEKLDPRDDQLHLVVIGASISRPHGARRISVIDCILRQALSDGVAIVPAVVDGPAGRGLRHHDLRLPLPGKPSLRSQQPAPGQEGLDPAQPVRGHQ